MTDQHGAAPLLGAIEAGGTKFVAAVARTGGPILRRARIPTSRPAETMQAVTSFFRSAAAALGPLAAIGIGSFGPIDLDPASPAFGTIVTTTKPGWAGMRYAEWLDLPGVPLRLDTDVNAAALGEWLAGAGEGCSTLAYTTVGTGIGTGLIRGGTPMAGFSHYEAGHIRVGGSRDEPAFAGICPFHGDCIEGVASGPAIKARFGASLDAMDDPAPAIARVAQDLGNFAATLVFLHAPDRLVFGGGVMKTPGLIEALRRETERRLAGYLRSAWLDPGLERYIATPVLGDDAGVTGALELARMALESSRRTA